MDELSNNELTNKSLMLQNIYNARRAHKDWVNKADKLVNGINGYEGKKINLDVDKTYIPLESASSEFGQWFHTYAHHLSKFKSVGRFVDKIEEHHDALHDTYSKIYAIFFVIPEQRSFLHKMLTLNSKKVSVLEREKAKIHLEHLNKISKELLEVLDILEKKIKSIDYNELNQFPSK